MSQMSETNEVEELASLSEALSVLVGESDDALQTVLNNVDCDIIKSLHTKPELQAAGESVGLEIPNSANKNVIIQIIKEAFGQE